MEKESRDFLFAEMVYIGKMKQSFFLRLLLQESQLSIVGGDIVSLGHKRRRDRMKKDGEI